MQCISIYIILGVKLHEGVRVESVLTTDGKVSGVMTDKGSIECDIFINCAGQVNYSVAPKNYELESE